MSSLLDEISQKIHNFKNKFYGDPNAIYLGNKESYEMHSIMVDIAKGRIAQGLEEEVPFTIEDCSIHWINEEHHLSVGYIGESK